jgi:iron complex outermembrane receptor protein
LNRIKPVVTIILALNLTYNHTSLAGTPTKKASTANNQPSSQLDKDNTEPSKALEDMVVTATRSEISASLAPANVTVVNEKSTDNRLTQRIGDALKEVPGIYLRGSAYGTSMPGSGMGGATIHGITDARRSLFMVDGLPVNSGASNNVDWNTLNMDDAKQVEFVLGPFSALYGSSAMGGVLNVISQEPTKREGSLTVGGGGLAVDQWGLKGKYRDRFANGLGVSLTYNHMDSSNWKDSDYLVVAPTPFTSVALQNAATPVTGAIPTTSPQGVPSYAVGLKGARPWVQDAASLRLYYDLTEKTKIDVGMAWNHTETSPMPLYRVLRYQQWQSFGNRH